MILRNLLKNEGFKKEFVNRFCDHLNESFESEQVLTTLEGFINAYQDEMPRHWKRWGKREKYWHRELEIMKTFGAERPSYMRQEMQELFATGETVDVSVDVEGGGMVRINDHLEYHAEKDLVYFEEFPIKVEAVPHFGFKFSHWEGVEVPDSVDVFQMHFSSASYQLKAVFKEYINPLAGKVIINEVSCNNKKTGDWIELYNNSEEEVNLEGWILTDLKNEFYLPGYKMAPKSYVSIAQKELKFRKHHMNPYGILGDFRFGLSKRKERIQLYTSLGEVIDSVGYLLEPTDSVFTYSLLLPELDNGDEENWEVLPGFGSPGKGNPYFIESRIKAEQDKWMKIGATASFVMILLIMLVYRSISRKGKVL